MGGSSHTCQSHVIIHMQPGSCANHKHVIAAWIITFKWVQLDVGARSLPLLSMVLPHLNPIVGTPRCGSRKCECTLNTWNKHSVNTSQKGHNFLSLHLFQVSNSKHWSKCINLAANLTLSKIEVNRIYHLCPDSFFLYHKKHLIVEFPLYQKFQRTPKVLQKLLGVT